MSAGSITPQQTLSSVAEKLKYQQNIASMLSRYTWIGSDGLSGSVFSKSLWEVPDSFPTFPALLVCAKAGS